jgi:hypothetical protein
MNSKTVLASDVFQAYESHRKESTEICVMLCILSPFRILNHVINFHEICCVMPVKIGSLFRSSFYDAFL